MRKRKSNKRTLRYYIAVFLLSLAIVAAAGVFMNIDRLDQYGRWLRGYLFVPFMIVFFVSFFDLMTKNMRSRSFTIRSQSDFILNMSDRVRETLQYSAEDFNDLREDKAFQSALHHAYEIYAEGESEQYNFDTLSRRLEPGSKAAVAIDVIVKAIYEEQQSSS